jgi:hypothetical protein
MKAKARSVSRAFVSVLLLSRCGGATPVSPRVEEVRSVVAPGARVTYEEADAAWAEPLLGDVVAGRALIESFFGRSLGSDVVLRVHPDRHSIEARWHATWLPPGTSSQCWMIASADATGIDLLSPGRWASEACGHDGADAAARAAVLAHEAVHVLHARANPAWGAIDWFREGLAVHASRQYVTERAAAEARLAGGPAPRRLSDVLPLGYPVAGSLVAYIDGRWGRPATVALLGAASEEPLLAQLGVGEAQLLEQWTSSLRDPASRPE